MLATLTLPLLEPLPLPLPQENSYPHPTRGGVGGSGSITAEVEGASNAFTISDIL